MNTGSFLGKKINGYKKEFTAWHEIFAQFFYFYVQSKRIGFCGLIIDIFQVEFSIPSSNRCH